MGTGHSPIYGFGADGYPIYGPWHDSGVLAQSCWFTRDYDDLNSATGCGLAGERSCLLVDETDITQGTVAPASSGPKTSDSVTSMSGNTFTATADDIVGEARGNISGSTIKMEYQIVLPKEAGGHTLTATDWLYLMENGVILNKSEMRKFGFKVAELVATLRPATGAQR